MRTDFIPNILHSECYRYLKYYCNLNYSKLPITYNMRKIGHKLINDTNHNHLNYKFQPTSPKSRIEGANTGLILGNFSWFKL